MRSKAWLLLLAAVFGVAQGQTPSPTVEPYLWSASRPQSLLGEVNVFRRFSSERTAAMREFYADVLGLPVLPATALGGGQMIRYPVGHSEVKLFPVAPSPANTAGVAEATGVRVLTFFFADQAALAQRFMAHGYALPAFSAATSHTRATAAALVQDPDGEWVELVIVPGASAEALARFEIGLTVADLPASRAFYRDLMGFAEQAPVQHGVLGTTKHTFTHGAATINLWSFGADLPNDAETGGMQYIVWNVAAIDAVVRERGATVDRPLSAPGQMRTLWLDDPDGVSNYFAEFAGNDNSLVTEAMIIEKQGAFAVGGQVAGDAAASLHCDHGVVEYQIPANARAVNLLMWHSASAVAWQARWDGGEGFQSIFLRRGFPVYLWDGPRVGRANWGCAETTYEPGLGRDQQNFVAWRFGLEYPNWFDGIQFPQDDPEAFNQAMRARYQEFDIVENIHLQSDAAAALVDKIGPTVALTNSAGGLRALMTAIKSDNLKGIVMYENVGYVFPQGELPAGFEPGGFGPLEVPLADFRKLTRIPLQAVWGDNVAKSENYSARLEQAKRFVEVVNKYGGKAEILMLSDAGLTGNTHIPFADMNNVAVADLLSKFLEAEGLAARRK